MDVAQLLADSQAAHLDYRAALVAKQAPAARAALQRASDLRQQAHEADPSHADPAWAATAFTHPHDALTAFYADQLAR